MKATRIENGMQVKTYDSGHVVRIPVQSGVKQEKKEEGIDLNKISDMDFKRLVLEKLGIPIRS